MHYELFYFIQFAFLQTIEIDSIAKWVGYAITALTGLAIAGAVVYYAVYGKSVEQLKSNLENAEKLAAYRKEQIGELEKEIAERDAKLADASAEIVRCKARIRDDERLQEKMQKVLFRIMAKLEGEDLAEFSNWKSEF